MRLRYDLAGIFLATAVLADCGAAGGVSSVPVAPPGATSREAAGRAAPNGHHAAAEYAYVSNLTGQNISAFSIDASGAMTQVAGSPFSVGNDTDPEGEAIDPKGTFLYVADWDAGTVSAFTIDASTGALTPVTGSPFAAGQNPDGVAIDSKGKFLYVSNENPGSGNGSVSAFTINASSGALTPVAGSPFGAGDAPQYPVVDPKGKFVYVTNYLSNNVSAYKIAKNGALAPVTGSPFATDLNPLGVTTDPLGKFLYVANRGNGANDVSAYTISATSGALTPVYGSPFAAGAGVDGIVIDPKAGYLYATDIRSYQISGYSINETTGALTALAGSPYTATHPAGASIDPEGKFVFATDLTDNGVNAFTISPSSGALTLVYGSPFATGTWPYDIVTCIAKGRTCKPAPE